MTDRIYYTDSYVTAFRADVVDASPDRLKVYLDRTAFYPTSGGQPFDTGTLGGVAVTEVIDEDDRIAHLLSGPLHERETVGEVNWTRRFDHMQQHSGQHLLSAVLLELFDAPTVSFHLGAESSTIDIGLPALDQSQVLAAEQRANSLVFENRPVAVTYQHSSEDLGLRKPTEREGTVRIVSIQDLDRSACGGTHVRSTGEIGPVLIRKLDHIRGNVRVEFLCGRRAVRQARADYDALAAIARVFSAPLADTPGLVEAQRDKLLDAEKARKRASSELAHLRGRHLYTETAPGATGVRLAIKQTSSLDDELRSEAQGFTKGEKAIYVAFAENPPAVLLAASPNSGIHAGQLLKGLLTEAGGRGGGTQNLAQGSVPSKPALDQIVERLRSQLV